MNLELPAPISSGNLEEIHLEPERRSSTHRGRQRKPAGTEQGSGSSCTQRWAARELPAGTSWGIHALLLLFLRQLV